VCVYLPALFRSFYSLFGFLGWEMHLYVVVSRAIKDSVSCGKFILDTTLIAPSLPHSFRPDDIPSLLRRQKVSHSKASGVSMCDAIRLKLPRTIANGDGWGSSAGKSRVSVFGPTTSEARRPLWSACSPSVELWWMRKAGFVGRNWYHTVRLYVSLQLKGMGFTQKSPTFHPS
jgi:hypothetical protein